MTVQGRIRGYIPSIFNAARNNLAIIPLSNIDPSNKFVCLEMIDRLLLNTDLEIVQLKTDLSLVDRKIDRTCGGISIL